VKSRSLILLSLIISGAVILIFTISQKNPRKFIVAGLDAPDFEVTDAVNGSKLSSHDLKGSVVFINFWASWCKECREELPSIEALYNEMAGNDSFRVVTIIYNERTETTLKYMTDKAYSFPVYSDPKDIASKNFGITGVPETTMIDKKGIVRKHLKGPADWNSPEEKSFIYSLLNE
jgi:thiol-disulfide isomerase/thioredoxin